MVEWFKRLIRPQIDPEAFLAELHRAAFGEYSDMDRYREFRAVFLESDAGKRVLRQILAWGHVWQTSFDPNPAVIAFAEGERSLALRVMAAVMVKPPEKPTKQNLRRKPNAA